MLNYLRTFFYPPPFIFLYDSPKDLVVDRIAEVFDRKREFFDSIDIGGRFVGQDIFWLTLGSNPFLLKSLWYLRRISKVIGQLVELQNGQTEITLKVKLAWQYYFMFFASIAVSLVFLFKFIQTGNAESLLQFFGLLVVGPFLCVRISLFFIEAIQARYMMFIDKKIKEI